MTNEAVKKPTKKELRKEQIVLSGLKVFCEKGYDGSTIDDIVLKAKCSHGLFYHYFKSKREIYDHVMDRKRHSFDLTLLDKLSKTESYHDKLILVTKSMFEKVKSDENFSYYFFFILSQCFSKKNTVIKKPDKNFKPPVKHLEEFFLKGQQQGDFTDKYSAFDCARLYISIIQGTTLNYVIAPKEIQKRMKLPNVDFILDIFAK